MFFLSEFPRNGGGVSEPKADLSQGGRRKPPFIARPLTGSTALKEAEKSPRDDGREKKQKEESANRKDRKDGPDKTEDKQEEQQQEQEEAEGQQDDGGGRGRKSGSSSSGGDIQAAPNRSSCLDAPGTRITGGPQRTKVLPACLTLMP